MSMRKALLCGNCIVLAIALVFGLLPCAMPPTYAYADTFGEELVESELGTGTIAENGNTAVAVSDAFQSTIAGDALGDGVVESDTSAALSKSTDSAIGEAAAVDATEAQISPLAVTGCVPFATVATVQQSQARSMLASVNGLRAQVGASSLAWDTDLEKVAIQRAAELIVLFDHTRPDGSSYSTALPSWASGAASGENIACGTSWYFGTDMAFEVWKSSPGHYGNMVSANYKSMAIACVTANGENYWVQVFSGTGGTGMTTEADNGTYSFMMRVDDACLAGTSLSASTIAMGPGQTVGLPNVTLTYGGTSSLGYSLSGGATFDGRLFDWRSSNSSIAGFYSDGSVIGVSVGRTTVYLNDSLSSRVAGTVSVVVGSALRIADPRANGNASGTSAMICGEAFPDGSDWVVLARDDDFADAMSATGLAGALQAPVVLTGRNGLSEEAADAIEYLKPTKCYIIGGRGAMPGNFENTLASMGVTLVERVYGSDSWDTSTKCAVKIAEHGGNARGDAIVAMSSNFQDALSMSSFAYAYGVPIYLQTSGKQLTDEALSAIQGLSGTVYVAGGNGAVPRASVENVLPGRDIVRLSGTDGYDTSNQIATYMVDNGLLSASTVCVACGAQLAKGSDALSGAALAGLDRGVMLLANSNTSLESVRTCTIEGFDSKGAPAFLQKNASAVQHAYVLGGRAVMPTDLYVRISELLGL